MAKRKQRLKKNITQEMEFEFIYDEVDKLSSKKQRYPKEIPSGSIWLKTNFNPKSKGQEHYISTLNESIITLCQGPAGCGKTWIATRFAIEKLINHDVSRIIVTKPILEAGDEEIGFLKGDITEKVAPHFQSIIEAFQCHLGVTVTKKLIDTQKIEFIPTAFCRGRNWDNSYILIDEAQNLTKKGIKLLMTRLSEGSIMSINGDTDQIDLPNPGDSGFTWAIERLKGKDSKIGVVTLDFDDIQRHPLIQTLLINLR